ncbi:MAG TPA: hypothetical protein VKP65_10545 [Rhodothermales bacterium]|nr:hypothetical protein [Rhodothermales bacterium]
MNAFYPSTLHRFVLLAMVLLVFHAAACDSNTPEDNFVVTYDPAFSAANFQGKAITHPFLPLPPGKTWELRGQTEDGEERILVEVLPETREVDGVTATVVRDRVYLEGSLVEDTFDWFAQDDDGNVWYLGEDSKEIENGQVVSTEGSWESGVDGAQAGIVMPATPTVGQAYQQEFYAGEAEDRGRVLSVDESVTVAAGSFTGCIKTEDTTRLEPDVLEYKYYCPDVGLVLEENLEDDERFELQAITGQ